MEKYVASKIDVIDLLYFYLTFNYVALYYLFSLFQTLLKFYINYWIVCTKMRRSFFLRVKGYIAETRKTKKIFTNLTINRNVKHTVSEKQRYETQ